MHLFYVILKPFAETLQVQSVSDSYDNRGFKNAYQTNQDQYNLVRTAEAKKFIDSRQQ